MGEQDGLRYHIARLPIGWTDIKVCLLQVSPHLGLVDNGLCGEDRR